MQKWTKNAINGVTVAGDPSGNPGLTSNMSKHTESLVVDIKGFMYVSDHQNHRGQRYPPDSNDGLTVAGQTGINTAALMDLGTPSALAIDDNLNLYVMERGNNRLMKWTANATTGIVLLNNNGPPSGQLPNVYGMLLINSSSNQVYLSDESKNQIGLWTFFNATPDVVLTGLNKPRGKISDPQGNLYPANQDNDRVAVFCVNSTVPLTVVSDTGGSKFHEQTRGDRIRFKLQHVRCQQSC